MELDELSRRLVPFCQHHYDDPEVRVFDVHKMPGHAGFAYGFSVASRNDQEGWFIRLPPPNVQWKGTADVLRQVEVLNALDGTTVPHCSVRWSGADTQWFGCPYFIVPKLQGDVLRLGAGEWGAALPRKALNDLGNQAMTALAKIHRIDWRRKTPYLGDPIPFEDDVVRWDRFYERAADPERLALVPQVRKRLLDRLPKDAPVGVFHGDFQTANLFCATTGTLLAVIDWELTGVGATLNDVGWIATFSDPAAWHKGTDARPSFLDPGHADRDVHRGVGQAVARHQLVPRTRGVQVRDHHGFQPEPAPSRQTRRSAVGNHQAVDGTAGAARARSARLSQLSARNDRTRSVPRR